MRPSARLTIGMPVYNGEALLAEALTCLCEQTFGDFHIIVCDNASTDATRAIVEEHAQYDARISYVRNETNIGANRNFSKVARFAETPFFKWAAHDDLYAPTYLERCMALLEQDQGVVLAHADSVFIDESGKAFACGDGPRERLEPETGAHFVTDPIDLGECSSALSRFRQVIFSSLWGTHMFGVIRTSALRRTRLIQDVPSSDRPLLAELALLGRFAGVREQLYLKRFHSRMSIALSEEEIRAYVSGTDEDYSKRLRQLSVFMDTPSGKPIDRMTATACRALVLAYGVGAITRGVRGIRHPAIKPACRPSRSEETGGSRSSVAVQRKLGV